SAYDITSCRKSRLSQGNSVSGWISKGNPRDMSGPIIRPPWRSIDGQNNALGLQAQYTDAFHAIGEIDMLSHRLLTRITANTTIDKIDTLVGVAIMRRLVTQFVGIRHLFEASVIDQAKLGVRAQFEALLAVRYLMFGGRSKVDFHTPID